MGRVVAHATSGNDFVDVYFVGCSGGRVNCSRHVIGMARECISISWSTPDGLASCAVVLVLSLYPYVYLFARAAFADQGADTLAAARSLGMGPWGVFFRIALPTAQPAIAAGAALVAMEPERAGAATAAPAATAASRPVSAATAAPAATAPRPDPPAATALLRRRRPKRAASQPDSGSGYSSADSGSLDC